MVTEKAMELGQALIECAEYRQYNEAKEALESDLEAMNLLNAYTDADAELSRLMAQGNLEAERITQLSAQLETLRQKAVENDKIAELSRTQAAFEGVMRMVNQIITQYINPEAAMEASGSCSGNCSSCAGCH